MQNLRYWRRARGLTQAELAQLVGVSVQALGTWERGVAEPYPRHIRKLCQVLDVTPQALLGEPGDERKAAAA